MKLALSIAVTVFCCTVPIFAQQKSGEEGLADEDSDPPQQPNGALLLKDVVSRLPQEKMTISGELTMRRRKGVVIKRLGFRAEFDLGASKPTTKYTILDSKGIPLETLTVTRAANGKSLHSYSKGASGTSTNLPDLSNPIQETDLSWFDLTLSFLWWPEAKTKGEEEVLGYPCHVLQVSAPSNSGKYASGKLWIEKKHRMLLRAEGYNAAGDLVRALWIKSFKKIDGKWMVKDMEVQGAKASHRTRLRIKQAKADQQP